MHAIDVGSFRVIDTDTHIVEPYDLWTSRISVARWGDKVPHVAWDDKLQEDAWYFGDERVGPAASAAQAGFDHFPPDHPARLADADPATYDPELRLARMDEYGIWAAVLYPNVAGFGAGRYLGIGDHELMLACVQAYNDFLVDFSSTDPRRYVPIMALPFWDLDASMLEIERCAAKGHRGIIMSGEPGYWGLPKLGHPHWDRLWAAAQDAELSINFHIGSGDMSIFDTVYEGSGRHANYANFSMQFGMSNAKVIAILITAGICHRFPRLNFVSVESGIGWLPFALAGLDWQWKNCGVPTEHPEYDLLPSEYFKRQIYGCFWFETDTAKSAIEQLGPDCILFESDFPHPTSMAPGPATAAIEPNRFLAENFSELPEDTLRKILHDNAARLYHLD